jgi:predicted aldo/keto reductase-like oxidoreductase
VLGFGVKQLPLSEKHPETINEVKSIRILRYAIDHGVNYLSLGYIYNGRQYENLSRLLGQTLQDGYRQKVKIAVSLPPFSTGSSSDFDSYLNEQLKLLQTDSIDFYLLGDLNSETWPRLEGLGVLPWAETALNDKRIGKLGFSFHDHYQALREILSAYDNWSLCQFQYSYMDIDHHPGIGGLKYAADKGLAIVVSDPLKGGWLTTEPPESVAGVWADDSPKRTLAEWGLRWVWNLPEVSTVVSDMSSMDQVVENIALAESAEPNSLTIAEQVLVSRVRDAYRKLKPIPCTTCRGCMPCPQGIDVPRIFELYNDAIMYNDIDKIRSMYNTEGHCIDKCNECGACVKACGKSIDIMDWLKKVEDLLARYE